MGNSANSLDFDCDWKGCLNLRSSFKNKAGYLLSWSGAGGLNLGSDLEVWSPDQQSDYANNGLITCAGIISQFEYGGDGSDPIRITCFVSKDTATEIRGHLSNPLSTMKVSLSWVIFDFDTETKSWFEASFVKNEGEADAAIDSTKGKLQMFIDKAAEKVAETLDLRMYKFEFQVVPSESGSSNLEFASGPSQRFVRKWTWE